MSVTLLLIPAALAAATVAGTAGTAGVLSMLGGERAGGEIEREDEVATAAPRPVEVRTRMKDPTLLADALRALGATGVESVEGDILAEVDGIALRLSRTPDEVWQIHAERVDGFELAEADAVALAERLDAAYAAEVQRAVAARIRARADAAGFELSSETRDDDDTLTMVLTVKEYA